MKRGHRIVSFAAALAIVAAGFALVVARPWRPFEPAGRVVFKTDGGRGRAKVRVVDEGEFRYLLVDGIVRGAADTSLDLEYAPRNVNVIDLARRFRYDPGKALLVGLGDGAVARRYAEAGWTVDAVEADPGLIEAAERCFGLDSTRIRLARGDPRAFVAASADTYDVIVIDGRGPGETPCRLLAAEALALFAGRLTPEGVLAVDVRAAGWRDEIVRSVAATLGAVFPSVLALPIAEPPDQLGDVILLASKSALEIPADVPPPVDRFTADYDRFHAWENRFVPDTRGARILTDGGKPLCRMGKRIKVMERKQTREIFERPNEYR
jgi:hypothetical protein